MIHVIYTIHTAAYKYSSKPLRVFFEDASPFGVHDEFVSSFSLSFHINCLLLLLEYSPHQLRNTHTSYDMIYDVY